MSKKEESVIRPSDIRVKANRYRTYVTSLVSDLAALFLEDIDPLEMGVRPIPSKPVDFVYPQPIDAREAAKQSEGVDEKLKKYEKKD